MYLLLLNSDLQHAIPLKVVRDQQSMHAVMLQIALHFTTSHSLIYRHALTYQRQQRSCSMFSIHLLLSYITFIFILAYL